jgi:hypothetical protein
MPFARARARVSEFRRVADQVRFALFWVRAPVRFNYWLSSVLKRNRTPITKHRMPTNFLASTASMR